MEKHAWVLLLILPLALAFLAGCISDQGGEDNLEGEYSASAHTQETPEIVKTPVTGVRFDGTNLFVEYIPKKENLDEKTLLAGALAAASQAISKYPNAEKVVVETILGRDGKIIMEIPGDKLKDYLDGKIDIKKLLKSIEMNVEGSGPYYSQPIIAELVFNPESIRLEQGSSKEVMLALQSSIPISEMNVVIAYDENIIEVTSVRSKYDLNYAGIYVHNHRVKKGLNLHIDFNQPVQNAEVAHFSIKGAREGKTALEIVEVKAYRDKNQPVFVNYIGAASISVGDENQGKEELKGDTIIIAGFISVLIVLALITLLWGKSKKK